MGIGYKQVTVYVPYNTGASNKVQLDILRWCLFFICLIILSNYFITFGWFLMLILRGDLLSVSDLHYFDLDLSVGRWNTDQHPQMVISKPIIQNNLSVPQQH